MKRNYALCDLLRVPLQCAPACTLALLLMNLVTSLLPGIQTTAVALFIDRALAMAAGNAVFSSVMAPLLLTLATVAWPYVMDSIMKLLRLRLELKLDERFRTDILEKRARLSYRHIENNEDWELITRVCDKPSERFCNSMNSMISLVSDILSIGSVLTVIMVHVWWAGLAVIAFSVPLGWVAIRAGRKQYAEDKRVKRYERRADYLHTLLTERDGVEERSLFGYADAMDARWAERYGEASHIAIRQMRRYFVQVKGTGLIMLLISALIVVTLMWPLAVGGITIGLFIGLTTSAFSLVQRMSWSLPNDMSELAKNREYCRDLTGFFALDEQEGALDVPALPEGFRLDSIEFRNVSFAYPGTDRLILNGFSAKLEAGRHYAVVGANGAGKTTLTKLLTGLYPEYEGEILINGRELRTYPLAALKAMFKSANQDFARYAVTVRENIELGDLHVNASPDADAALAALELDEAVGKLAKGADTPLGKIRKDSVDLSGGQWQRLALARTYAAEAQMRILDEPTAALDPMAESAIYSLFGRISRDMTTLFITHRLGAARLADEIIVLNGGRVAETGSHDVLMARGGLYAAMFESQRSWFE